MSDDKGDVKGLPAEVAPDEEIDMGPYGPRGKHTPPLTSMFGGYGIIFGLVILLPLIIFVVVRFVIL
ncbi:hypothetical protein L6R52_32635 [Myxococcota bacterium]|nr:hypothetical protein [Myxococcota bacterium]